MHAGNLAVRANFGLYIHHVELPFVVRCLQHRRSRHLSLTICSCCCNTEVKVLFLKVISSKITLDITPLCGVHHLRSAQLWHVPTRDHTVTCSHTPSPSTFLSFDGKQSQQLPAFAFPAVAAPHLPTLKAWIGELA